MGQKVISKGFKSNTPTTNIFVQFPFLFRFPRPLKGVLSQVNPVLTYFMDLINAYDAWIERNAWVINNVCLGNQSFTRDLKVQINHTYLNSLLFRLLLLYARLFYSFIRKSVRDDISLSETTTCLQNRGHNVNLK